MLTPSGWLVLLGFCGEDPQGPAPGCTAGAPEGPGRPPGSLRGSHNSGSTAGRDAFLLSTCGKSRRRASCDSLRATRRGLWGRWSRVRYPFLSLSGKAGRLHCAPAPCRQGSRLVCARACVCVGAGSGGICKALPAALNLTGVDPRPASAGPAPERTGRVGFPLAPSDGVPGGVWRKAAD